MATDDNNSPRPTQRYSMADLGPAPQPGSVAVSEPWYRAGWVKPVAAVAAVALVGFLGLQLLSGDDDASVQTADAVDDVAGEPEGDDDVLVGSGENGDDAGTDVVDGDSDPGDAPILAGDDNEEPILGGDDGSDAGETADEEPGVTDPGGSDPGESGDPGGSDPGDSDPGNADPGDADDDGSDDPVTTTTTTTPDSDSDPSTTTTAAPREDAPTTTVSPGTTVTVGSSNYVKRLESFFDDPAADYELDIHLSDGGGDIVLVVSGWDAVPEPLCFETDWEQSNEFGGDGTSYGESAINTCGPVEDFTGEFTDCGDWAYVTTGVPANATGEVYVVAYDGEFEFYAFPEEDFFLGNDGALPPFTVGATSYTLPAGILPSGTAGTC